MCRDYPARNLVCASRYETNTIQTPLLPMPETIKEDIIMSQPLNEIDTEFLVI